jgi:hypothetical protein
VRAILLLFCHQEWTPFFNVHALVGKRRMAYLSSMADLRVREPHGAYYSKFRIVAPSK